MPGSEEGFQKAMNQGHSAAWDQNWGRAAAFYRQALEEFPDRPQVLTSLGQACIELQEYEEALRCYQTAARLLPDDPLPLEKIGQLCERTGSLEYAIQAYLRAADLHIRNKDAYKAVENWEHVTQVSPENLLAHSRLAMIYERIGEKSKAVNEYLASASTLQAAGNPEKARQAIEQALKVMPGSQEAELYQGMLKDYKPLPKPSRIRGISGPLKKQKALEPPIPASASPELDPIAEAVQKALKAIAEMLFESEGEYSNTARKGLQEIVSGATEAGDRSLDSQRMMLHLSQVVVLQANGEIDEASKMLLRAMEVGFEHTAAHFDLGFLSAQLGRADQAISSIQRAARNPDFALGAHLLLGDLFYQKGNLREASLEYLQALKLADMQLASSDRSRELGQLYELLIETHLQQEDPKQQERLCENIQKMLKRSDWRAQIRGARQQLPETQEQGPLIPIAEVLTQANSSQVVESISAISELTSQRMYHTAMEETFYALQLAPTFLPMHAVMGDVLVKIGDVERAVAKFEVVSRAYSARGEMLPAVQFARKVVALSPVDLEARTRLIDLLVTAGQAEQAIVEYTHLAEVYQSLADLTTARKTYMEAFKAAQLSGLDRKIKIKLLYRVADIDMQSMDWRQAVRILEQIRTLQPDEEEARAQIVQLSLRLGQEPQAMAEVDNFAAYMTSNQQHAVLAGFILRLLEEYPENIPLRRRLVDAFIRAGQVSEAVTHLDTIGERLLQAGDRAGAIQTIETIISLEPPNRLDYLTLLNQMRKDLV